MFCLSHRPKNFPKIFFLTNFILEKFLYPFVIKQRKMRFITSAKILREECKSYDFDIDNSKCHANDMLINLNVHEDDQFKD